MGGDTRHPHIEALLSGNQSYIQKIYSELLPKLTIFVSANGGDSQYANELLQEALLRVIQSARQDKIKLHGNLDSYIYMTCKNLWFQEIRQLAKVSNLNGYAEVMEQLDMLEEVKLKEYRWQLFEEKLALLPEGCRALLKDYLNGMSYREILEKYQYANENTAFQRVFKCKRRVMELVRKDARFKKLN